MPNFPSSIWVPRVVKNLPGITFDTPHPQNLYAEDYNNLANEVVSIENVLGENLRYIPTVLARVSGIDGLVADTYTLFTVPAGFLLQLVGVFVRSKVIGNGEVISSCQFQLINSETADQINPSFSGVPLLGSGSVSSITYFYGDSINGNEIVKDGNDLLVSVVPAVFTLPKISIDLEFDVVGYLVPI